MNRTLEVCCGSLASVDAAVKGGAERIELCSALLLDGLTPSVGTIRLVRQRYPQLKVHVLIRQREGDFVYTRDELQAMLLDIREALPWADGIVSGALTPQGDIDMGATQMLMEAAADKPFTFHRAFDVCRHPLQAMEQLIGLGCRRILTSGQQPSAEQGIELLRRMNDLADGRIIVMPGGGVNIRNVRLILDQTGCTEIHGSCKDDSGTTSAIVVEEVKRQMDD